MRELRIVYYAIFILLIIIIIVCLQTIFDPSSDGEIAYLLLLTLYWHQLRCISFSLSSLDKVKSKTLPNCLHFLAYSFYLPCFFFGPIIIYKKINVISFKFDYFDSFNIFFFLQQNENTSTTMKSLRQRLSKLIINLIRYFFWMYFTEFILHYVYINMFLQNIKVCFVYLIIKLHILL